MRLQLITCKVLRREAYHCAARSPNEIDVVLLKQGLHNEPEHLKEAVREALEETSLRVSLKRQFHAYSEPDRDPRHHTITIVFVATASGSPKAADDAINLGIFTADTLPSPIVFDHADILRDYFSGRY